MLIVKKYKNNPIIDKYTKSWYDPHSLHVVFNPAVFEYRRWVYIVARAEFKTGISRLIAYRSRNGLTRWQPVQIPSFPAEDPRVTFLNGNIYCTYTIVDGKLYSVGIRKLYIDHDNCVIDVGPESILYHPNNKNVVLFPKKIAGKFWALHRPETGNERNIWISWSMDDKFSWSGHSELICANEDFPWKSGYVGAGCPPIEVDEGWLILYHGVKKTGYGGIYRMGVVLLEKDNPESIISELPYWIMGPELSYERVGYVGNVVFPTGCIQKSNKLRVYYGAADQCVCVADLDLKKLLSELEKYKGRSRNESM